MIINFLGHACVRVQSGGTVFVVDPFGPDMGLKLPRVKADVVLISHNHNDHNYKEGISGTPRVFAGPGEYEVAGMIIRGIESFHDENQGKDRGMNTIFRIEAEGITLAHFGDFGQKELTSEQREKLSGVDIVFVPVGGVYTVDAKAALKMAQSLGPKIIIPIHYKLPGLKYKLAPVDEFLSAAKSKAATQEKLTIRRSELEGYKGKIIVLKPGA